MKKILVLMLIATMMITSLLALSAAKDETKSIKSTINAASGPDVNNLTTNKTTATNGPEMNSNKTIAISGSEAAKSTPTTTSATNPEPTSTTVPVTKTTTTTTTSGSETDLGLASMENWLNQPVNFFPWYSSGVSFYTQAVPDTTFSPFREFYITSGAPVVDGIISIPIKFDIAQKTPTTIYYGVGQALPYSQYVSTMPSKTNDLWIQGATSWSQYVVSPVGTWMQLVASAPVGGSAGFYEIVQTDTTATKYSTYQFNQGYNTMNFYADQVGRHMLYFVVNNQPSNVVIVDVFAQAQPG